MIARELSVQEHDVIEKVDVLIATALFDRGFVHDEPMLELIEVDRVSQESSNLSPKIWNRPFHLNHPEHGEV